MSISKDSWLQQYDSEYLFFLRAFSILIIVFGHTGGFWFFPPWSEFLHVFMPIFFFISGVVSYASFLRSRSIGDYLKKRIMGILVPYYCVCIFAMLVYLYNNESLPQFSAINLVRWLTITPNPSIMPFPLGQVWFLHTLLIICLMSPIFFYLYRRRSPFLLLFFFLSVVVSSIQTKYKIAPTFVIGDNNLFKPLVHSLFFCLGFVVIDTQKLRSQFFSILAIIFFGLLSYLLVILLALNPDYEFHTYAPDIYYVSGSLCAIWIGLLLQPLLVKIYRKYKLIQVQVRFLFRYTFAIYLLHSFAIYFVEKYFGLVNPQQKTITYGVTKLIIVLAITFAMSPPFTKLSQLISNKLLWAVNRGYDGSRS
jgi:peptidoglycan/LPS O-acetylase OafA/YrhL